VGFQSGTEIAGPLPLPVTLEGAAGSVPVSIVSGLPSPLPVSASSALPVTVSGALAVTSSPSLHRYSIPSGLVAVTSPSTGGQTLVALVAGSAPAYLTGLSISFDASATTSAIRVELCKAQSLPVGTVASVKSWDSASPSPTASGLVSITSEPTGVDDRDEWLIQPYGGMLVLRWAPFLGECPVLEPGDLPLCLRLYAPSGVTCNALATVTFGQ
jgi:hypothetical protein